MPPHANRLPPPTPRLVFRAWTADDGPLAWQLWGDPTVSRYIGGPFTREQVAARLEKQLGFARESGMQYWPLFVRADGSGEFVGCCGLKPGKNEPGQIEHGFYLRPQFQGQGLGYEAASAVVAHAFSTLGAASLFAGHHPQNAASRALLLKLGFVYSFEEFYPPVGLQPAYLLSRADWRARVAAALPR